MDWTWPKFLAAAIPAVLAILPFAIKARLESRAFQFTAFHTLIKDLVEPGAGGASMQDRQIAIVYELRRFWKYHPVIIRILTGLNAHWSAAPEGRNRLFLEIHKTLRYAEKRVWIQKWFGRD